MGIEHAETGYKINATLLRLPQLGTLPFEVKSTCFWFKVWSGAKKLSCSSLRLSLAPEKLTVAIELRPPFI